MYEFPSRYNTLPPECDSAFDILGLPYAVHSLPRESNVTEVSKFKIDDASIAYEHEEIKTKIAISAGKIIFFIMKCLP